MFRLGCGVSSSRARRVPPFLPACLCGRASAVVGPLPARPLRGWVSSPLVSARWGVRGSVAFLVGRGSWAFPFLLVFCVLRVFFFAFFLLRVVFFRSFGSCLELVPSVLARFLPRCRWFGVSAGRLFSAGSLSPCPVFPCRLGCARRSASRRLVPVSLPGCVGGSGAPGRWAGLSLVPAPRRWVCRSARGVLPSVASSFRCFLSFF